MVSGYEREQITDKLREHGNKGIPPPLLPGKPFEVFEVKCTLYLKMGDMKLNSIEKYKRVFQITPSYFGTIQHNSLEATFVK